MLQKHDHRGVPLSQGVREDLPAQPWGHAWDPTEHNLGLELGWEWGQYLCPIPSQLEATRALPLKFCAMPGTLTCMSSTQWKAGACVGHSLWA